MMKNYFFKSLVLCSLLFVIGCAEQNAEKAVNKIKSRYFAQIELQEVPVRQHEVVFIDQEKLDEQLTILSKIEDDMGEIVEKYPETKVVSGWLTDKDLSKYYFNKEKVDRTIDLLTHEKKLFRIRDKILALDGTDPEEGVFNFDFGETVTSSCSASRRLNKPPYYGFWPNLETKALKPFFLKFDTLVDSMILTRELQEKAIKELPRDDLPTFGINKWKTGVGSPADVYNNSFKDFVSGRTFLKSKSGEVKDELSQQLNKVLASCSSDEAEFVERVGSWLPTDSKMLLEVVGNKRDKVPVYVTLYGDTPEYDRDYLFDPLVKNLKKKYGDPLFPSYSWNSWITDDGRLIIVEWVDRKEVGLTYVHLPLLVKNFQSWIDTYNDQLSDFIGMRTDNIKEAQKSLDEGLQSKL